MMMVIDVLRLPLWKW